MTDVIFLVDMQSFYASIEKLKDPRFKNQPVIVAGDPKQRSGIVLAACPQAKKMGVKTAEPLWQALAKCPHAQVAKPNMSLYIDISMQITECLERYSDLVEVYSIDEQFVDVTHTLHLFGNKEETAKMIQADIMELTGIQSRVGIGPNKVLAKMACDHFAKKNASGIAELSSENIKEKLWPLPISCLFGVGSRMEKHLIRMGLHTIGHLADHPIEWLKKRWGINGEVLHRFANGIDTSPVTNKTHSKQKAIGHHMTLPRDYTTAEEIKVVLYELAIEVARRTRKQNYLGNVVGVSVRGSTFGMSEGFSRQQKLSDPTQLSDVIYQTARSLFEASWTGIAVRAVGINLSGLESKDTRQLSLFDDPMEKEKLEQVIDELKENYGALSIMRASSLLEAGQAQVRANKIGGHWK